MRTFEHGELAFTFRTGSGEWVWADNSPSLRAELSTYPWTAEDAGPDDGGASYPAVPSVVVDHLCARGWEVVAVTQQADRAHLYRQYFLKRSSEDRPPR